MKYFLLALICALSLSLSSQTLNIDVNEMFGMPDYLAMDQTNDLLNLTGLLNSNFNREGFEVVNLRWAQQQFKEPTKKTNYQEIALDIYNLLIRSISVDPSLRKIKKRELTKMARESGIGKGMNFIIDKGIEDCVRQGSFVVLPNNIIAVPQPSHAPIVDKIEDVKWTPPVIYRFDFNYIYRDSFTCGKTIKEFYASLNDMVDGKQIASIKFEQPTLGSMCKQEIIDYCIKKLMEENHHIYKFQKSTATSVINNIAIIGKEGKDCKGKSAEAIADDLTSNILKIYNVVDRENMNNFFEEQRNMMTGLYDENDFIEAGRLAGAEGIVFVNASCINRHTEIDVTLSSTTTGSIQWSIHSENLTAHDIAEKLTKSLNE